MKRLLLAAIGAALLVFLLVNFQAPSPSPDPTPIDTTPETLAAVEAPLSETVPEEPRKPVATQEGAAPVFHPQPADGWIVEVVRRRKDLPGGEAFEPVPDARVCVVGEDRLASPESIHWFEITGGLMDDRAHLLDERCLEHGRS